MEDTSSSEEESKECTRKQKILKLVNDIQKKKDRTKRKHSNMSAKREPDPGSERGKHSVYKLYIGHQHFTKGKYRVVTVKKGCGIRQIEYKADEDLSVQDIICKAIERHGCVPCQFF